MARKPKQPTIGDLLAAARKAAGHETVYSFCRAIAKARGKAGLMHESSVRQIEADGGSPTIATFRKLFEPIGWEVVADVDTLSIVFRPKESKPKRSRR